MSTTTFTPNLKRTNEESFIDTLSTLAAVRDGSGHAISYYCTSEPFPAKSHWEASAKLEHLIKHDLARSSSSQGGLSVSEELLQLVRKEEHLRPTSPRFLAVFECKDSSTFEGFALPAPGSACRLEIDSYFHIVPLWQALQASLPYCTALVGQDSARCFTIRGVQVQESVAELPSVELPVNNTGAWSHHVDGSERERQKHFLNDLASALSEIVRNEACTHLVVGCREEVWAELGPSLSNAGLSGKIAGHFHLPNLAMPSDQVLEHASLTMTSYRESLVSQFWQTIRENPERSAIGIEAVLGALQAGRAQKILLTAKNDLIVGECFDCNGCVLGEGSPCPACGGSTIGRIRADELLLRKALISNAEILSTDGLASDQANGVAALLRY